MIALSHSRLSDYEQCPLKFKLKYLDKAFPKEDVTKSPHLVRGGNVHKALENYIIKVNSGEQNIPASTLPEVETTKPMIRKFFEIFDEVLPEMQLAVNTKWEQVEWYSKDAYYRVIIDAMGKSQSEVLAIDWKTGKVNDYSGWGGQLHLTATALFGVLPEKYEQITTAYLYVDHKKTVPMKFHRKEHKALIEHFDAKSAKVNAESEWSPTPNDFCKWCEATKAQCKFSRKL